MMGGSASVKKTLLDDLLVRVKLEGGVLSMVASPAIFSPTLKPAILQLGAMVASPAIFSPTLKPAILQLEVMTFS